MTASASVNIKKYPLQFRTLNDLRAYCRLLDTCPFDGFLQAPDRKIAKDDILEILNYYLNTSLMLCVRNEDRQTLDLIETFLKHSGLPAAPLCTAAAS